jgi:hypothetical protein
MVQVKKSKPQRVSQNNRRQGAGIDQKYDKYLYNRAGRLGRAVRLKVSASVYAPPDKVVINSIPTAGGGICTMIRGIGDGVTSRYNFLISVDTLNSLII